MKVKIPSKTVEVCDLCRREIPSGCWSKCIICKKEYCRTCEAIIGGCIHQPKLCRECSKRDAVYDVVQRFASRIQRVLDDRDAAMVKAGKDAP